MERMGEVERMGVEVLVVMEIVGREEQEVMDLKMMDPERVDRLVMNQKAMGQRAMGQNPMDHKMVQMEGREAAAEQGFKMGRRMAQRRMMTGPQLMT